MKKGVMNYSITYLNTAKNTIEVEIYYSKIELVKRYIYLVLGIKNIASLKAFENYKNLKRDRKEITFELNKFLYG